jgi:hypothetical protein
MEDGVINPVPVTLESLQHLSGRHFPQPNVAITRSGQQQLSRPIEGHRTDVRSMTRQDNNALR